MNQPVVELETGKATVEVPSTIAGTVTSVLVSPGDEIRVGADLFTIDAVQAAAAPEPSKPSGPSEPESPAEPAEPEEAPPAEEPAVEDPPVAQEETAPPVAASEAAPGKRVAAAPSVRRFAREIGIDLASVPGTGPLGRISINDVKAYSRQINSAPATPAITREGAAAGSLGIPSLPPLPDFSRFGEVESTKMSMIRRKTAEQMSMSWLMVPHVSIFDTADITELDALRKQYADRAEASGGKLTVAVILIKIVAQALKNFPQFNASVDMANRQIITKKFINIGVAVDTERGLLVPVIRNADTKNIIQIAAELAEVVDRTRKGKVDMADLEGGTFSVSNLGRTCGTFFTPIINYPEVAILGIGRMTTDNGRKMLPLSLSFDHRAADGADASRFLAWIVDAIKEPFVLSLEG